MLIAEYIVFNRSEKSIDKNQPCYFHFPAETSPKGMHMKKQSLTVKYNYI